MLSGIIHAPVPALVFSAVVVGQTDGQPGGIARNGATGTAGIGAGGAMRARVPEPDIIRPPVELVADIASVKMPPYFDNTAPLIGIASRAPAATLRRVSAFQVA